MILVVCDRPSPVTQRVTAWVPPVIDRVTFSSSAQTITRITMPEVRADWMKQFSKSSQLSRPPFQTK